MKFIAFSLCVLILSIPAGCVQRKKTTDPKVAKSASGNIQTLTENGAWCWFSDPRAIYYSKTKIITGWVKNDGSVEVASLNPETQEKKFHVIHPQLEADDHDNPAFTVLADGNILTMFAWHGGNKGIIYNLTNNGPDIQSFGKNVIYLPKTEELLNKFPKETYTYANPFVLKDENNRLFSFGRWIGYKPNMIISTDDGHTWKEQYVIISSEPFDPDNRPYAKYYSDGKSKIHLIFTDGHPRNEPGNSVYYCYYENRAFWRADNTKICNLTELPFTANEASLVYRPGNNSGRAWISDVVTKNDVPYILYTRHPEETDHRYHYAWYNKTNNTWEDHEICKAGKWFPQTPEGETEREPHYMGNMTLHPLHPETVYLSREVNGVFEIEKYKTSNGGNSWEINSITKNSIHDNVRPYVPRNQPEDAKTVVLWMENKKYIHYTNFDTRILYFVDNQ